LKHTILRSGTSLRPATALIWRRTHVHKPDNRTVSVGEAVESDGIYYAVTEGLVDETGEYTLSVASTRATGPL